MSEPIASTRDKRRKNTRLYRKVDDIDARPGAGKRAFGALADDGNFMIVEPMTGASVEDDLNPVGRTFSRSSTVYCTANSLALGGSALGAIATDGVLRAVVLSGGFKHFDRTTERSFNRVSEARK